MESIIGIEKPSGNWGLISGNKDGQIMLIDQNMTGIQDVVNAHSRGVRNLVVSPDGQVVISAGDDGCVFVLGIKEEET